MLLIAAFAIYVIITRRVQITRTFVLAGSNARNYGIALLLLLFPAVVAVNLALSTLPHELRTNVIVSRIVGVALLSAFGIALALPFRNRQIAEGSSNPTPPNAA